MAQSLAKILVHVVFSTKNRSACLGQDIREELYSYMATVLKNLDCPAIQIGGTQDHIHILGVLSKNLSIAQLVEGVKTPTSRWLKSKGVAYGKFHWQSGYGAFSVSQSNVGKVVEYIVHQEEHHREMTFKEELRRFLKKYGVTYDEEYLWD